MERCYEILDNIKNNIEKVIKGKPNQIEQVLCCWLSGGHCLIEDVPGTGKTILARSLARSLKVKFRRIQFTPDLLPSDVLGVSIFNRKNDEFEFRPGPIFTTILLGDEINRATPRAQSALLEGMSETQATIDGKTYPLDKMFFTIATQNPIDQVGTFPLPEAQLDRFLIRVTMGYPSPQEEIKVVKAQASHHPIHKIKPVETIERLAWVKDQISNITVSDDIYKYAMSIVQATRNSKDLLLGASPRATIGLIEASKAMSMLKHSHYVKPNTVFDLIVPVLSHRLILTAEAKLSGYTVESILKNLIEKVPVPISRAA